MSLPVLYVGNKNYSSWSMRPWLVLKAGGLGFTEQLVRLDTAETRASIAAISPMNGKVPALRLGQALIWDSLAIAEWAAGRVPALWPADETDRALARAAAAQMHSGFAALRRSLPMNLKRSAPLASPIPEDAAADIADLEGLWAVFRARFGDKGPYLCGTWSIADAFFTPAATRLRSYCVGISEASSSYVDALLSRPEYLEWQAAGLVEPWANAQTDAM